MAKYNKKEIKYQITGHYGVIKHGSKSWSRQVNIVKWEDNAPLLDIRDWSYDQSSYGKGMTFSRDEAIRLRDVLINMNLGDIEPLPYPEAPEQEQKPDAGFGGF